MSDENKLTIYVDYRYRPLRKVANVGNNVSLTFLPLRRELVRYILTRSLNTEAIPPIFPVATRLGSFGWIAIVQTVRLFRWMSHIFSIVPVFMILTQRLVCDVTAYPFVELSITYADRSFGVICWTSYDQKKFLHISVQLKYLFVDQDNLQYASVNYLLMNETNLRV